MGKKAGKRSVVTAKEVSEWRQIRGWRYKDIALVYGYAWSTVWYHMAPKKAQEKQREAWRNRKRREYRAKILGGDNDVPPHGGHGGDQRIRGEQRPAGPGL